MSISTPNLPSPAVAAPGSGASTVTIVINGQVRMPANLTDLDAFRRWARSDDCPREGRFSWINGVIRVETAREPMYSHNGAKTEAARVLSTLVRQMDRGIYLSDGMLISIPGTPLSTVPDGLFVSYDALQSGRVRRVPNVRQVGAVELEGPPEMVLEVVSDSSEEKDFVTLPDAYHLANVQEFWRIDARGELRFEILRWTAASYVPTRQLDGWWRSDVFSRDFLLTQDLDPIGQPRFTLRVGP